MVGCTQTGCVGFTMGFHNMGTRRARLPTKHGGMVRKRDVRNTRKRNSRRSSSFGGTPKPDYERKGSYCYTLNIAGYPIPVFSVKAFTTNPNLIGAFSGSNQIYIQKKLGAYESAETMLHEILHAISSIGLPRKHRLSEEQVALLSVMLLDTIRRNQRLQRLFS